MSKPVSSTPLPVEIDTENEIEQIALEQSPMSSAHLKDDENIISPELPVKSDVETKSEQIPSTGRFSRLSDHISKGQLFNFLCIFFHYLFEF